MLQNVVKPPPKSMHAAAIRACAGEGGLPAIRSLGLFESCNFIGAVALQGGPASAMRPWPRKGTTRRCHGRRGSGRKPGWPWDAAWDECHGVEREDRDKGERCVRCVPRCRGGCVGVRNVFLAFQETETHNPITVNSSCLGPPTVTYSV